MTVVIGLILFCLGYGSNDAFNDRRLVELAQLVPVGSLPVQTTSQNDSSLSVLNTAVCHPQTPPTTTTTTDGSTSVDVAAPADDESTPCLLYTSDAADE